MMLRIERALEQHEKDSYESAGENFFTKYKLAKERLTKIIYIRTAGGFREGNDHGPQHILRVLGYLDRIPGEPGVATLSPYELYLVAMSVLYHDIGLLHQRKKHSEISAHLLKAENSGFLFDPHDKEFMAIAIKDHSSSQDIKEDSRNFSTVEYVRNHSVRIRLIAALVRLADELDEDHRRAPADLQQLLPLPNESKFYWAFNQHIQSVEPQLRNNSIRITMSVNDEDNELSFTTNDQTRPFIELAMEKIIKINTEREYCNQFFPDNLKYNETILRLRPISEQANWKSKEIIINDGGTLEELIGLLPGEIRPESKQTTTATSHDKNSQTPSTIALLNGVSFAKGDHALSLEPLQNAERVNDFETTGRSNLV